ncbi:MAG: PAS domain S-box protein [Candidatus Sericytochromatia bacterium]|nr:PAS domain S-box protein [Candidatus Tanganyikabacteria bacterium]
MSKRLAILLALGDSRDRRALARALAVLDVDLVEAETEDAAIEAALDREFALAIVDLEGAGADCAGLARRLRSEERTRHLPIVFLTDPEGRDEEILVGCEAGAVDFLAKPCSERLLLAKARVFLDLAEQRRDLLERREALEDLVRAQASALLASAERAAYTTATALDGFWEVDLDGRVLEVNDVYLAMSGYTRTELLSLGIADIEAQETPDEIRRHVEKIVASGRDRFESRHRRKDGTVFDVEVSAMAGPGDGGEIVAFIRDITERKRVREELIRLRQAVDASSEAIFMTDRDGTVTFVNPAFTRLYGYSAAEVVGKVTPRIIKSGQAPREAYEAFWRALLSQQEVKGELVNKAKDGRLLSIEGSANAIVDDAGDIVGFMAIQRDIGERKQLQAQIAQADRLASMGQVAASVAHEINNPLSYVLFHLEVLARELPTTTAAVGRSLAACWGRCGEDVQEVITREDADLLGAGKLESLAESAREALAGTRRIKDVSRGLGSFSRVEPAERTRVDVRRDLESAIGMAYNEIRHRARLVKDLGPVPGVLAGEGPLSQVFLNLLMNAVQAIPEGDVENHRILVRTWVEGGQVQVEVADTGCGIPAEHLAGIFEPFFTTKAVGQGTGLGLAICKRIVGESGGDLRVESEVGKGSRFVVSLPALPRPKAAPRPDAGPADPAAATPRGRILVVDDERGIRGLLQAVLGEEHEVVVADSGVAARDILARDPRFDLILCDLMMPGMTGMDLHDWLSAHAPDLAARVAFMTAGAFTNRAAEYLALSGRPQIAKPFDTMSLPRLVADLILAGAGTAG